jgi:hypothetical protein
VEPLIDFVWGRIRNHVNLHRLVDSTLAKLGANQTLVLVGNRPIYRVIVRRACGPRRALSLGGRITAGACEPTLFINANWNRSVRMLVWSVGVFGHEWPLLLCRADAAFDYVC